MKFLYPSLCILLAITLGGQTLSSRDADTLWISVDTRQAAWVDYPGKGHIPFRDIRSEISQVPVTKPGHSILCYRVRPKDNLFRISRIYLDMKVSVVRDMNSLESSELDIGQVLTIGYLGQESPRVAGAQTFDELMDGLWKKPLKADSVSSEIMRSPMDAYREQEIEVLSAKGVAYWNRSAEDYSRFFVLHPQARINSLMEVSNPMNGRTVHAKVVGKIPENAYTRDITLVVSPAVARQLGVLDPRFYVTYQYIQ